MIESHTKTLEDKIWDALFHECPEIALRAIEQGANVNDPGDQGWTPLHGAAEQNALTLMRALIDAGADVNAQTGDSKEAPLHVAAEANLPEAVRLLLDAGADIEIQSGTGASPLNIAAFSGSVDALKVLIEREADVNHTDRYGNTPLLDALAHNKRKFEPIEILIEAGADFTMENELGQSAAKLYADTLRPFLERRALKRGRATESCDESSLGL